MAEQSGALKRRLIAAAVLIPAVVVWVLFAPPLVFAVIAAVLLLLAAWEWAALSGLRSGYARCAFLIAALILMALGWWVHGRPTMATALLAAFTLFWLLVALDLRAGAMTSPRGSFLIQGLLVLAPAWFAVVVLHGGPDGPERVLALLAIVWAADAGAYFAGRRFGRHCLAPRISPGKTWEGLAGGLLGAVIAALIASLWCRTSIAVLVPLAVGTALFSAVGDLAESRLKRSADAKDSGKLIPGHGGLLDRIDSLCAAAPVFALGLQIASLLR